MRPKPLRVEAAYLAAYETFEDVTAGLPRGVGKCFEARATPAIAVARAVRVAGKSGGDGRGDDVELPRSAGLRSHGPKGAGTAGRGARRLMLALHVGVRVHLPRGVTDMRKGFDGLRVERRHSSSITRK